jgi:hypothetical protein
MNMGFQVVGLVVSVVVSAVVPVVVPALALTACEAESRVPVAPADVTFLIPLAPPGDATRAPSQGRFGVLVPRSHFDHIAATEPLTVVDEPVALYDALSVVAVRLDPCFVEGGGESPCKSQVRLVLQPVFQAPDGAALTTRDAAVHAFYSVPRAELDDLTASMSRLRQGDGLTLGVHPAPARALALVLQHVGAERLVRITHMSVHGSNEAWIFGGFDIIPVPGAPDGGQRRAIAIVGIDSGEGGSAGGEPAHDRFRFEQHLTSTGATVDLDATLIPDPVIEPDIVDFLAATRRASLAPAAREASLAALNRLLDPQHHDPGTVDCASCHIATSALRFATRDDVDLADIHGQIGSAYDDTRNQRMFGYFGATPSISRRVHLETDAIVERLNAYD